jgi:hypothetical protein
LMERIAEVVGWKHTDDTDLTDKRR